jgi:hypothetical protein
MRTMTLALLAAATALGGCGEYGMGGPRSAGYRSYDWNRPDPTYGSYEADRYYREGRNYRERRLSRDERVYRGRDGRYYCRRNDGTTGLIVGGVAGGLLGNIIAPGGSETLGTLLGAAAGAAVGQSVDKNQDVRCR